MHNRSKGKPPTCVVGLAMTLLTLSITAMSPAYAEKGDKHKRERLLVCHYDAEGDLRMKLLPVKAAERHYQKHTIPSEIPHLWSDASYRCEVEQTVCTSGNRYEDLGDGTVQDCNTDLVWLKDASCLGTGTWFNANTAAAALADGSCDLTDGSSAGDWRLPDIGELCNTGAPQEGGYCPAGSAVLSLVDSSIPYSGPAVSNTVGDGRWVENDPFVSVKKSFYWSFTEHRVDTSVWVVNLANSYIYQWQKIDNMAIHAWPVRAIQ